MLNKWILFSYSWMNNFFFLQVSLLGSFHFRSTFRVHYSGLNFNLILYRNVICHCQCHTYHWTEVRCNTTAQRTTLSYCFGGIHLIYVIYMEHFTLIPMRAYLILFFNIFNTYLVVSFHNLFKKSIIDDSTDKLLIIIYWIVY